jgi:hypothetical protein
VAHELALVTSSVIARRCPTTPPPSRPPRTLTELALDGNYDRVRCLKHVGTEGIDDPTVTGISGYFRVAYRF